MALLVALALLAASHLGWVAVDGRPPAWDEAVHLEAALRCARVLGGGDWRDVLTFSAYYPPLVPCAAGLLHRLLGPSPFAALAVTQAALAIAAGATYRIGTRLGSPAGGLAAAFLVAGYTEIVLASRGFLLDLPLTALVASSVLVLLRTDGFTRPGWCALAGVLGGLGLLTKWTYPVFVAPVAGVVWLAAPADAGRARRARHLALALAVAAMLAAPWYLRHLGLPLSLLGMAFARGGVEGDPAVGTAEAWTWYVRALVPQIGPPFVALFAAGLAIALVRRPRGLAVLLVWLVAPLVFFAALWNKDYRYTLPCLPAVALLSTAWIGRLAPRPAAVATGAIALAVAAHVAFLAWGWPAPAWARGRMERGLAFPSFPPVAERWPITEVLDRVTQDRAAAGRPERVTLAVVPDSIYFSPYTFAYYATREDRSIRVAKAWRGSPRLVDYAVTKGGDQGPEHTAAPSRALMARLAAGDPTLTPLLTRVAVFPLPDGGATLYRVEARPVTGLSAGALLARLRAEAPRALGWAVQDARGLALDVEPYSDAETLAGRFTRVTLRADAARVGDFRRRPVAVRLHDVALELDDVRLDPHALAARGEIEWLGARRLVIRKAVVTQTDLAQALTGLAPWLDRPAVSIADGRTDVTAGIGGVLVAIALRLDLDATAGGRLAVWVERARLGPVPVPAPLVNLVLRLFNPAVRLDGQPIAIVTPSLSLADGRLTLETSAP